MTAAPEEIERRRNAAISAIREAYGTADDEHGATLFVSHHRQEIGADYWLKHCGVASPEPTQLLDILVLSSQWRCDAEDEIDEDGLDTFDFTLPGEVTDYVISVEFDENGEVSGISMEG